MAFDLLRILLTAEADSPYFLIAYCTNLFGHRYVLGQLQHPAGLPALETSLRRGGEHSMVRHEAAEALGAIEFEDEHDGDVAAQGERRKLAALRDFSNADTEPDVVIRESCEVALDATDYWSAWSFGSAESSSVTEHAVASFAEQKSTFEGLGATSECHFNRRSRNS